jgi:hypothetical protein
MAAETAARPRADGDRNAERSNAKKTASNAKNKKKRLFSSSLAV